MDHLKTSRALIEAEFGGSLRRWKETVSQIVIVASAKRPQTLVDHFLRFPMVLSEVERSSDQVTVQLNEGFRVTLIVVKPQDFAMALLIATGSRLHLEKLQAIAAKKRLRITPNGIVKSNRGVSEARPRSPQRGSP